MKYLVQTLMMIMLSQSAYSLGDTSLLPANPEAMSDTVETLFTLPGQTAPVLETEKERNFNPQDVQERQYQEDRRMEAQEWEDTRSENEKE